ncbi:MAG: hypothetical protein ABSH49_11235 [Bryobacteraceae bacterium]|jgi:hypothetical protein
MNKRPLSVTLIGWLFIATGVAGLAFHAAEFRALHPFPYDTLLVCLVSAIAIVSGAYMLRGGNWARWLAIVWLAFHAILGAFHSLQQLVVHSLLLAVIAHFLLRPKAREYFRQ